MFNFHLISFIQEFLLLLLLLYFFCLLAGSNSISNHLALQLICRFRLMLFAFFCNTSGKKFNWPSQTLMSSHISHSTLTASRLVVLSVVILSYLLLVVWLCFFLRAWRKLSVLRTFSGPACLIFFRFFIVLSQTFSELFSSSFHQSIVN